MPSNGAWNWYSVLVATVLGSAKLFSTCITHSWFYIACIPITCNAQIKNIK